MIDILLLAAGTSGRILSISDNKPKPLIKLKRKSILIRNLEWLSKYKFINNIWINIHFRPMLVKKELRIIKKKLNINFSYEKKILGTAGAAKKIANQLSTVFIVVYSDNLLNFNLSKLLNFHLKKQSDFSIALYCPSKHFFSGIASSDVKISKNNKIISFKEKKSDTNTNKKFINTGVYIINKKILSLIPSNTFYDFSSDVFPKIMNNKYNFFGHVIEKKGYCLGLDTPSSYYKTKEIINSNNLI